MVFQESIFCDGDEVLLEGELTSRQFDDILDDDGNAHDCPKVDFDECIDEAEKVENQSNQDLGMTYLDEYFDEYTGEFTEPLPSEAIGLEGVSPDKAIRNSRTDCNEDIAGFVGNLSPAPGFKLIYLPSTLYFLTHFIYHPSSMIDRLQYMIYLLIRSSGFTTTKL